MSGVRQRRSRLANSPSRTFGWGCCVFLTLSGIGAIFLSGADRANAAFEPGLRDKQDGENADTVCAAIRRPLRYDSVDEAVWDAEAALDQERCRRDTALIYSAATADGRRVDIRTQLHFVGSYRGGYIPGRMLAGETILRLMPNVRRSQAVELRLSASGFETYVRRAILHPGEIVVWDDIVLKPLTRHTAASIAGRVWLEDDADPDGLVISVNGEDYAFTDESGRFVVEFLSPGELDVHVYKPGYTGMRTKSKVGRGKRAVCDLSGYRQRYARVRWVYQPDGTRDFPPDLLAKEAVLAPRKLDRVRFAIGFQQANLGRSDFSIRQEKDRLILYHFDVSGQKNPKHVLVKKTPFDEILTAPESGYTRSESVLREGHLYVFRCYDGKHYAAMEVLTITDERPALD